MTTMPQTTEDRRKKRGAVARFVLAGVAVIGIGAAATSAAWTNDAWFRADASAASVELQGSLTDGGFVDADTVGAAVVIPATEFEDLVPGDSRVVTVWLYNDSTVDLALGTAVIATDGDLFDAANGTVPSVAAGAYGASTLEPGDSTSFTVTITTKPTWENAFQGLEGEITVQVTGSTTL